MSDELGLLVEFKANYNSVTQGFDKIAQGSNKLIAGNQKVNQSFDTLANKAKSTADTILNKWLGLGVALSAGGLILLFNKTAESIDHLTDTARGLGVSAQSFQKLAYGAQLGGVGMDDLSGSLKKFNISVGEALQGNTDMIASFKALGINIEDLRGKDIATQYATVAASAAKVKDGNIAAANSMAVFGRNYTSALSLGRDGLQNNIKEFDKLGVTLTDAQRKAVDSFNDSKVKLDTLFTGFAQKVVADTAPAFQSLIAGVSDFVEKSGGIEGLATSVGAKIVDIVQATIDTFNALKPGFEFLLDTLGSLVDKAKAGFVGAKSFANQFSDNLSQGSTKNQRSDPGVSGFIYDQFGLGEKTRGEQILKSLENLVYIFSVAPPEFENNHLSDTYRSGRPDPRSLIAGGSFIAPINQGFPNAGGSTKSPYGDTNINPAEALKSISTAAEKSAKGLGIFNEAVQKSSDLITSGFKSLEGKDLGEAINRIFGLIENKAQSQEAYDADTKAGAERAKALGGNVDQYNLNRQLNRPSDTVSTTSEDFDKQAASLIQALKEGLSGPAFSLALRSLSLQSQVDLKSGTGSADRKVIDEIQKYATSLGANKQQVEVGITVTPTKDFSVKVFTNQDAAPYLAAAVAGTLLEAASQGAQS